MDKNKKLTRLRKWGLAALFCAGVLLSGIFFQNSLQIYEQSRSRTTQYLTDVTYQLHEQIEVQVQNSLDILRLIRNGALDMPAAEREAYLADQTGYADFNRLHMVDGLEQAEQWLQARYGARYTLDRTLLQHGRSQLLAIPDESTVIYFAAGDGEGDDAVIIGAKQNDLLVEMLSAASFDGNGITMVITQSGVVITSRTEQNFFTELEEAYEGTPYADVPAQLEQMRRDLTEGRSGTLAFPSSEGEELLLSYEPLSFSDWWVFTVIPADALNTWIEGMTTQNLLLTAAAIVLLVGCIVGLVLSQRRHNRRLSDIAFVDRVTGGWSALRFRLEAERVLRESGGACTMVSLDVADFTFLNNVYGVEGGDRVLRYIFGQIIEHLRYGEIAGRSSADIFYILLRTQDRGMITSRMAALKQSIEAFDGLDGSGYRFAVRIGAYLIEDPKGDVDRMAQNANLARKYRDGQDCSFYRAERLQEQKLERELISDMQPSLRSGAFQVYLQPKVQLDSGAVCGAEALIRWDHPSKGMLSPAVFIPVFEKAGMIGALDRFMFEEVCKLLQRWTQEGRAPLVVSVNLSRQNIFAPALLSDYRAICDKYGVSPAQLELELTESIFMENTGWMQQFVQEMHRQGFRCSLDDFGSGFSSLGLLKDLDIDVIKLDRSFFTGEREDLRKGALIVESVLGLAQELGIQTVAEGIERYEQVDWLQRRGCGQVQGFVFFRPMPAADFEQKAYDGRQLRRCFRPREAE